MPKIDKGSFEEISKVPKAEKTESDANMMSNSDQAVDTEKELKYKMLLKLMKSIRCMPASIDKKEMYQHVAKQFTKLSGYKDSEECAITSKGLAIKTKKEFKKLIYKRAQRKKNEAKLADDYKSAAEEFRKISGFRDSDDMAATCDQLSINIEKKAIRKRVIKNGIVLLCIIIVILIYLKVV